ncbi:carbohydrate kinase [Halochromatium glycolicum]|uniref:Carbohydrate kinase n=1 Tax=Halochromatium glycolicum TaxID=85075 RepID=A0AAJ0U3M9_9GAMM|nr:carbohydrate kinase [Halochromatium glycolicum]
MAPDCWIGLDLGTSGCRAIAIDADGSTIASASTSLPAPESPSPDALQQDPELWWQAALAVLRRLQANLDDHCPRALCVDGTSATLLLCDSEGRALTPALMYNDARALSQAEQVAEQAPEDSPARGPSASLAKLLYLRAQVRRDQALLALHQADWIGGRLRGRFGDSDWNNGLKLGFDPEQLRWPSWLGRLNLSPIQLPQCHPPGSDLGSIDPEVAAILGLPAEMRVCAGTTDSNAAALAAGAREPGDAVTSLGSTLALKLISECALQDARSGVYSHRMGDRWLAGGASNSGGAVLRQYFSDAELARLSERIDPDRPTGLHYYPLPRPGERFPTPDPQRTPRLTPRPAEDHLFLAGILEGIAHIEREGYQRLCALGAPRPKRILSTGGGARNEKWNRIRARVLGLPVETASQQEAAYGAATLARGL